MGYPLPVFSKPRARNVSAGPPFAGSQRSGIFTAVQILALSPAAWYRYGMGISNSGGFASQWDDQSGNLRHLIQATGTNQPAVNPDQSLLFDGVDNWMKAATFTLNQPATVYLLARQVTWTNGDRIFDGNTVNTGVLFQSGVTPAIVLFAGSAAASNTNLVVNTYAAVASIFNGVSSLIQVNNTTATTGDAGAANMAGFTLGAEGGGGGTNYGNIEVKEIIIFPAAHTAATRAQVIAYLRAVGGI